MNQIYRSNEPMYQLIGEAEGGKVAVNSRLLEQALKALEKKKITITIEEFQPQASRQMRGYYFAAVVEPARELCGYSTKEEMHEVFKTHCNAVETHDPLTGEVLIYGKCTKGAKKWEFHSFIERCSDLARYLGVIVKSSEEYYALISDISQQSTTLPQE